MASFHDEKDSNPFDHRWYHQTKVLEWGTVGQWHCVMINGRVNHIVLDGPDNRMLWNGGRMLTVMSQ